MANYTLLPTEERQEGVHSHAIPIAGRRFWAFTLNVAEVSPGGSFRALVEASVFPYSGWKMAGTFGVINAPGTYRLGTDEGEPPELEVGEAERWLRFHLLPLVGSAYATATAETRWMDPHNREERFLLSKEDRSWNDALPRLIQRAEADVEALLITGGRIDPVAGVALWDGWGLPLVDLSSPQFGDAMRAEIIRQVEHLMERERLRRSREPSATVTLREMEETAPGLGQRLEVFYHNPPAPVWRGR